MLMVVGESGRLIDVAISGANLTFLALFFGPLFFFLEKGDMTAAANFFAAGEKGEKILFAFFLLGGVSRGLGRRGSRGFRFWG